MHAHTIVCIPTSNSNKARSIEQAINKLVDKFHSMFVAKDAEQRNLFIQNGLKPPFEYRRHQRFGIATLGGPAKNNPPKIALTQIGSQVFPAKPERSADGLLVEQRNAVTVQGARHDSARRTKQKGC
jgi:hypothetical protein